MSAASSWPAGSILRETALALVADAEARSTLCWLGEALHEHLIHQPAPADSDRSLAPAIAAVARDLRYLSRVLGAMDPHGERCDVTRAAFAHRAAYHLEIVARFLGRSKKLGSSPARPSSWPDLPIRDATARGNWPEGLRPPSVQEENDSEVRLHGKGECRSRE